MKTKLMVLAAVLATGLLMSCTTGQYMTVKSVDNAEILGIIQTSFSITGAFRYRSVINTQAYMHLLAEAQKEYDGIIDVQDITWAIGKSDTVNNNYEYTAVGKVVRKTS